MSCLTLTLLQEELRPLNIIHTVLLYSLTYLIILIHCVHASQVLQPT